MEIIGAVIAVLLLWFFGYCASCYTGPVASTIEMLMKGAAVVVAICFIMSGILSLMKNRRQAKEWKANNPTPLPYGARSDVGPRDKLKDTPENRKKLMAWNEKNFRRDPKFIYPGPEDEDRNVRRLRYSLFTSEQLAAVPFSKRINIRNPRRHPEYLGHDLDADCPICGNNTGASHGSWCGECKKRYQEDLADGWEDTLPSDFNKEYKTMLWGLQQCVAIDLMDGKISDATARIEMKEVIEVAKQNIMRIKTQEDRNAADRNQKETEQKKLSNIARDLSRK